MSDRPETEPAGEPAAFSVLVATYNQARYVRETLDSVAAQTNRDYEIVVVNDGSTDDTEASVSAWIGDFRRSHPNRVVLSTIPNGGQSAAWEHGFRLCRGRYVCLLDSDDRWLPNKLAAVSGAAAADPGAGMIVHPLYVIDPAGRRTGDVRPKRAKLSEGDLRTELRRSGRHVAPATSGIVISSGVFAQLVPMATRGFPFGADAYLSFGASMLAPVRALAEPLGEYRLHPGGQYIRRMLSAEGLSRSVELQLAIAGHFGVAEAARLNSGFARNVFALAKMSDGHAQQLASFGRLGAATWRDGSFGLRDKLVLLAFWSACLVAPRPVFSRLWRVFQFKQTGFDKVTAAEGDGA
jgi:glycosyltransferase involved in cell wall biosynthesis